ncbi:MAG: hypothetical protein KDB22_07070 [Planctomycetales bacterium]|nr:hypothetical protein [Planctomycetales bacterium]
MKQIATPDHVGQASCSYGRPSFSLRSLFLLATLAAALAALLPVSSVGSCCVLAAISLTISFGCPRTQRIALLLVPILYLPYLWLFVDLGQSRWSSYRWQWIGMYWQLPGLLFELSVHPLDEFWFQLVTATATIVIFLLLVTIGRTSRLAAVLTCSIALLASIANSLICLALYRA